MLSLRSILFAAAAFATIASAIPAPQLPTVPLPGGTNVIGGILGNGALGNGLVPPVKRGALSFGDRISDCHDKIALIVIDIGE